MSTETERRIAEIVNEWFQNLPTPVEQQRDRSTLIRDLVHEVERVKRDWYASNRRIAHLEAEARALRATLAHVAEMSSATAQLAREHGKES